MHKSKIDNYKISELINKLKDYVNCELLYISNHDPEDVKDSMQCLFSLSEENFMLNFKHKKGKKEGGE